MLIPVGHPIAVAEGPGRNREHEMPLYEYKCEKCEEVFFELRRIAQREDPILCPGCGGEGKILFSTFAQGGQTDSCSEGECPSGST